MRIALVLAAVAALAGPVFVTPAREAAWAGRVARAVVLDDRTAPPEDELRSAAVGATFARTHLRDAVGDAVRWLGVQRPAAREIVVFSTFRRGTVSAGDFVDVPDDVSVRLIRSSGVTSVREREISRLQLRDEGLVRVTERLTLGPTTTEVREIRAERLDEPPITVSATPERATARRWGLACRVTTRPAPAARRIARADCGRVARRRHPPGRRNSNRGCRRR